MKTKVTYSKKYKSYYVYTLNGSNEWICRESFLGLFPKFRAIKYAKNIHEKSKEEVQIDIWSSENERD